jgi:hypothetical protein
MLRTGPDPLPHVLFSARPVEDFGEELLLSKSQV